MRIRELLARDPFREITSVIRITDHDPHRVWMEMDEYVPTDTVKRYFREILDALAETRQRATERVCIWVSGFFGSGKSHFMKVLGYLLENRPLRDPDGQEHSSSEFLCRKLALETFLPLLTREIRTKVLPINLLDYDPQNPQRPTISRLIYRSLLEQKGLSTEFWVAEWEKELQRLGKWESFQAWVQETFQRPWTEERRLNAEVVLRRALPALLPERYRTEEEAVSAIQESKHRFSTVSHSEVVAELYREAQTLHPQNGRMVVLLDEAGLYVGDSVERLTDLNDLAEQVVQQGEGKVLLTATAQEALADLVPRLTTDRHILEWLRDRFRLRLGLEPTEVQMVVANRLLAKTGGGANHLRRLYQSHQGSLLSNLSIDRSWGEREFIDHYPCPPYAVKLMQDIMGAMRGSIEEARRLSGSERSMLKNIQAILTGEGGVIQGAEQGVGWLVGLDLFYDALAPDLTAIRSEQARVIRELAQLGEVNGIAIDRVAKALFLLQHLRQRIPCSMENLASALVDRVDADINSIREAVQQGLQRLQQEGWVAEEDGQYRLLTPAEHDLERDVRANYPTPAELKEGSVNLLREILRQFRYEHGQIRRPLKVAITVDGQAIQEEGELAVELFTPFAEETQDAILQKSIAESETLFWKAAEQTELKPALERTLAIEKTLEQWRTRSLTPQQEEHKSRLEREAQTARQMRLPQLMQQAFLHGRIFLGGQEIAPSGNELASVLRSHLQTIATQLYTEFVDDRPDRDEECTAILTWQPGTILPAIYTRRNLLTATNQIHHDAGLLATVKAELTRRHQMGQPRTGKDLLEHFEKKPYGWDPRLVRLLVATLFKAGLVSVRYQNRDLTDPTDAQARPVFVNARDFQKAIFSLLPEVNWRQASELCSSIFGVQGGDTFERTAAIVHQQASRFSQDAQNLVTRCRDNGLPSQFADTSRQVAQTLTDVAQRTEPNARLRRFLEHADTLNQQMPIVRRLKEFAFDEYRKVRAFFQTVSDWADNLSGEAAQRWQRLQTDIAATDLLERWNQIRQDYGFLLSRYRTDYLNAHRNFQAAVQEALQALRSHEAFQAKDVGQDFTSCRAQQALQPLGGLVCEVAEPVPSEETFRCPRCHRSFAGLSPTIVVDTRRHVESALDDLLPKPPVETLKPLSLHRTIEKESEVDALTEELRRYWRKAQRPLEVRLEANVGQDFTSCRLDFTSCRQVKEEE